MSSLRSLVFRSPFSVFRSEYGSRITDYGLPLFRETGSHKDTP
jgi:hypothetical protein